MNRALELRSHLDASVAGPEALGFNDEPERSCSETASSTSSALTGGGRLTLNLRSIGRAEASSVRGPAAQASRLSTVQRLLCYLRASVPETQIPGPGLLARPQRHRPYIFTQQELVSILDAAAAMRPRRTLRPHVYVSMIGLLASTGIRAGEAIRLTSRDVLLDADPPRILVLETGSASRGSCYCM